MENYKKNIRRVFWLYFALFAALAIYLAKFIFVDSESIITSPYNPRLKLQSDSMTRGEILDANGKQLAYTKDGKRSYPLAEAAAHIVGYADSNIGFYGVEARYNFNMQNAHNEIIQRVLNLAADAEIMGDSPVMTIDADLQTYIYNQLSGKSAAVVMEPSTGKILAMVSRPGFNPEDLDTNYQELSAKAKDTPLLNRATQGLYPPGSIFKIVTAAAGMEFMDIKNFSYVCYGEAEFDGKAVRCYNSTVHGEEALLKAFSQSCNTYFCQAGLNIGSENLRSIAERLYFNVSIPYPLEYSVSSFSLDKGSPVSEIVDTAIGQGKTQISPLLAVMITAAIANGGIMMSPYVVDHLQTYDGQITHKSMPSLMRMVFTPEEASDLRQYMTAVTTDGTGKNAAVGGVSIAAKTGTAEHGSPYEPEPDHGWYTAFFPAENPQYAISILVENSGGSGAIMPVARNIINYLIS
ncbi:MAG: hypothetical protein LBQ68_07605 [Clostridiales bacterium]|jgi:peptidoglycan glycosyltransferase|nr:hypothetical protein [Clostridiales bacterium]